MSSAAGTLATNGLARPGRQLDWYPERAIRRDPLEGLKRRIRSTFDSRRLRFSRFAPHAVAIEAEIERLASLPPDALVEAVAEARARLLADGFTSGALVGALALAGMMVRDAFGFSLHREQYFCAWLLLHGTLAEMATGEGKSVTAAITASVAAMAGVPVHVITVNDYLVERDAKSMEPLFSRLGLSSSFVSPDQTDDERRANYMADICYVSNKQVVFDYLRDRQVLGNRPASIATRVRGLTQARVSPPLLRGLCFAIVDEADSVLIDDAITPLILSQQIAGKQDLSQSLTAMSLARRLTAGTHFLVDRRARRVTVSEDGEYQLATMVSGLAGVWKNRRYRLELVRNALAAMHVYLRDRDYIVRNDEVLLIDQSTGRVMPDRKLQHGLHQMVETKEKCELSGQSETFSSISFQRFFQRYHFLCGMSGTIAEAAGEMRRVYGLGVVPVPTHRPSRRESNAPIFCADHAQQEAALIDEIGRAMAYSRPVLVGTRSLAESERLARVLRGASIPHKVLNARQDGEEARIVAEAGQAARVTIATNMAGRGTDIPLADEVRENGGLQVIVAELNDNRRIDRQLIGRSARQGDPGSFVYLISLEDELLERFVPNWFLKLVRRRVLPVARIGNAACLALARVVQIGNEHRHRIMRRRSALADEQMNARLSFVANKE